MLKELFKAQFGCPVCGRILYRKKIRGYWCPYCGSDLNLTEENPQQIEIDFKNRLTARDENDIPYYIGRNTFNSKAYPEDLNSIAIAEILEKLCQYEEIEVENDKIIDKLVGENN